jgi:hypothetical protein
MRSNLTHLSLRLLQLLLPSVVLPSVLPVRRHPSLMVSEPNGRVLRAGAVPLLGKALLAVPPTSEDLVHSVASVKLLVFLLHPPSPPRTRASRPPTRTSQRRSPPRTLPMPRTRSGSRLRRRHG